MFSTVFCFVGNLFGNAACDGFGFLFGLLDDFLAFGGVAHEFKRTFVCIVGDGFVAHVVKVAIFERQEMDNREQDEADDGALQCPEACPEKAVGLADDGVGYCGVQKMPGKLCKCEWYDKTDDEANRLDRQGRHVKILDDEVGEEQV